MHRFISFFCAKIIAKGDAIMDDNQFNKIMSEFKTVEAMIIAASIGVVIATAILLIK